MRRGLLAAVVLATALSLPARAADAFDAWANVKVRPAPLLNDGTIDPRTAAPIIAPKVTLTHRA